MANEIKILIIEDEIIVAKNIEVILKKNGYFVCGVASNYSDAVTMCNEFMPDLILSDIRIKGYQSGIDVIETIFDKNIPVIFITAYSDDETLSSVSKLKPAGYITKPYTKEQLLANVSIVVERLIKPKFCCPSELTKREFEIVREIVKGLSTKEIAEELSISNNTVETHRKNIFSKLNLQSAVELVAFAFQKGWVN